MKKVWERNAFISLDTVIQARVWNTATHFGPPHS